MHKSFTFVVVLALGASPALASAPASDAVAHPAPIAALLEPSADPASALNVTPDQQLEAVEVVDDPAPQHPAVVPHRRASHPHPVLVNHRD